MAEPKQGRSVALNASFASLAAVILFTVAGCGGARDVDYLPSRGISADVAATHEDGATLLRRGITTEGEPIGSIPWQIGERH